MQQTEERIFDHYFEQLSGSFVIWLDSGLNLVRYNRTAEAYMLDQSKAWSIYEVFGLTQPEFKQLVNTSTAGQKFRMNPRFQSEMPVSYYFVFLPCEAEGYICIGETDPSEMDTLRDQMIEANAEINNLMREMSVQNKELKYLNRLKNQFLAMASHDLRNPIGVVAGYSDFILNAKSENLTDQQRNIVKNIQTSAYFMNNMLNNFLDLSQIETGNIKLDPISLNLIEELEKAHEFNQVLAEKKNIQLNLQQENEIPTVTADPNRLAQVFNNLIVNAVKYSEPNTQVFISLASVDNQKVLISVKDQGPGIPENELLEIFNAFSVCGSRTTGGERSTGLGLAIVKNLVEAHRGEVWVESQVGQGSTFFVSLPINTDYL